SRLANQAARARRETRKPEMARQTELRMHRREAMRGIDPRLGGQVFEMDPQRRCCRGSHCVEVARRKTAPETFDDDVGQRRRGCRIVKAAHADLRARLNAMFF